MVNTEKDTTEKSLLAESSSAQLLRDPIILSCVALALSIISCVIWITEKYTATRNSVEIASFDVDPKYKILMEVTVISYLLDSLEYDLPFNRQLSTAISLLGDKDEYLTVFDALVPLASTGVPTKDQLTAEWLKLNSSSGNLASRFERSLDAWFSFELSAETTNVANSDMYEYALAGDLTSLLQEIEVIGVEPQGELSLWLANAKKRQTVDDAFVYFSHRLASVL